MLAKEGYRLRDGWAESTLTDGRTNRRAPHPQRREVRLQRVSPSFMSTSRGGPVAERLPLFGAIDAVEPNPFADAVVHDGDGIAIRDAYDLAGDVGVEASL